MVIIDDGTELGLSISFGVINNQQRDIEASSKEGKATCFIITIPLQQKAQRLAVTSQGKPCYTALIISNPKRSEISTLWPL